MVHSLYLDTARMGCMSPTALLMHAEFVRLAAEDPCSLYTQQFLFHGANAVARLAERFPQLRRWHGVEELKSRIAQEFAGHSQSDQVLLASRTKSLMELVAPLLASRCRRVLVTDLIWPPYLRVLRKLISQSGSDVCFVSLRERLFHGELSHEDILDLLGNRFEREQCDGLFLPLVDHCGARLPIEQLTESLRQRNMLNCCVIDASQSFGHVETKRVAPAVDLMFGGAHKWVSAYLPLGIGLVGNATTRDEIRRLLGLGHNADPLLMMLESAHHGDLKDPRETVNITPLLACRGALADLPFRQQPLSQPRNHELTVELFRKTGWRPLLPQRALQTGILLGQADRKSLRIAESSTVRRLFQESGLAVTTYPGGYVRLSLPFQAFTTADLDLITSACTLLTPSSRTNRRVSFLGNGAGASHSTVVTA